MRPFLLLLLLAGCAAPVAPPATFRDPAVPLSSKADHDPARLAGRWHEVARFPDGGCAGGTVDYAPGASGVLSITETCGGRTVASRAESSGPGRMNVVSGDAQRSEWVLWTDADARTAVLVHPDGSGGRILNRMPDLPPDRRRAAETVLDFNGFDISRLAYSK